ncbi:hypothetical protein IscW_ISCW006634 [Ixodes scapularis]|uniref:Uncharacterized protein n=1 Tax=Ixodes scapularis TaxID=6945 RepID=B7PKE5_IXOSC|nr:hypothetical protein IscW_ISCW006634 [Ixodes scapularis]|eukprot:XP_002399753.1 hypothetical protein IscW_ISCW006634 [Ixodes scapularis]
MLLEALATVGHAADNLGESCELTLAGVQPVGGFAILREVEAEDFDGSLVSLVPSQGDPLPLHVGMHPKPHTSYGTRQQSEQWEAKLACSDLENQEFLIERACKATEANGILD